ncbi:hypothetical protein DL1_18685 [Thioclava dalianensis]|uniref:Haem-binding uptake Tiki superfamily ChaN domain-containing protein n=1 Tax=Thioclava dalianensis TaxID=1185766 RepID=A0A074TER3_9RHOB|nr:ChaN family lipoprotein [Thioclava dalianensis]KEP70159.1 hypothetical protein DL1_18685 [Thioclava dalianensis]SFM80762.1 Uncharacterized iron-regulated protein [Thioclava dalianensis]
MKQAIAALYALTFGMALGTPLLASDLSGEIKPVSLDSLSGDIFVLGEVHDNPTHHRNQARALRAIAPKAVVFEMLSPEQAARITPDLLQDPAALGRAVGWEEAGWPDIALYAPVFDAIGEARIFGATQPRAQVRAAMTTPLPDVFGPQAARYGLDRAYPDALQRQLEDQAQVDHCNALPPEMLPGMVAAQRFRDAAFARSVQQAYEETGGPVALIAGSGHARTDLGVPAILRQLDPTARIVALGQIERAAGASPSNPPPYDIWIVTPPTPRPDPCAAFK